LILRIGLRIVGWGARESSLMRLEPQPAFRLRDYLSASGAYLMGASARLFGSVARRRPGILLNTMPKSGSVYIAKSLAKMLALDTMAIGHRYALIDQIDAAAAQTLSRGGYVSQNHLAPSAENLQILRHFDMKLVLHLRDPRQALLSWVHHLDRISGGSDDNIALLYFTPRTPLGYFEYSLHHKIDWQIENYLPQLIAWTAQWLAIADDRSIPVLITHQDDLRCGERAFFEAILAFYQIELDCRLPGLPRTLNETHFRRADPAEWRRTFLPDQIARATTAIPQWMRSRFDWGDGAEDITVVPAADTRERQPT
jgi:hypothetical protein